ncbi:protein of unknown function [Citrobacter amalonaticus]|uniref:Uncharacterized protein n=1 Tax=Citrobacter amalonaticus TaxID=35703 RepID=A0AAX2BMH2_CITAM|nr:protein of unknown function [Citrobacter amalonaticus]SBA06649.1 protein of unknown function [Citrobacter amalonaticus]
MFTGESRKITISDITGSDYHLRDITLRTKVSRMPSLMTDILTIVKESLLP